MERPRAAEPRHESPPPPRRARRWPVLVLLAATAVLYLWDLSASGWGNSFYAAAAQAGAQSWKAWLFGSLDAGNAITVDKPPAAMWIMGLSARIFGVNSWSILAPQALMGVASVYLLYASVKRWFGQNAGLLAGAALALTPVAVLMFRYDNPDALLVLLMTAGAYTTVRAVEKASWKWLALTGVLLGFGFLTKMMQAFLVLPAFALVYLIAAPTGLGKRIRDLLIAGVALIASAGWYIALVSLWPASSRPFIAGSTNNTLWELALGYNGLGRIFGGSGNGGGGGGSQNTGFGGATGIGRLFGSSMGTEISWLLPAALIALVTVLALTWTAPRTDRARAGVILWGGWLLVTGITFSYMSGTIHPYYTVALAPAIAAMVAIGGRVLWLYHAKTWARALLSAMILATAVWGSVLMGRADWLPALRWASLALGVVFALVLLLPAKKLRGFAVVALVAAILTAGASGAAYAASTATVAHNGSIPTSGPSGQSGMGGMGTRGGATNRTGAPGSSSSDSGSSSSSATDSTSTQGGPGGGGMGGSTSSTELTALLKASTTKWSAAISGATSAAELELDSGTSVIALGGWNGSDASPTLAQFQAYVAAGQIHYFIASGGGMGGGGSGGSTTEASQIATWVAAHYTSTTVGSTTVYDLTATATS
ncbi:glycosyl transferase [Paractinoplanes durhamensis]|uniref:Glycosyl transferase n=2 Tax=Paractinoplanes durhamensis TaxID=113563 RepID=A0ABQ3ZA37_9ACTN|nr:glycosyl transferase [Actinoplanes durhamensis]